MVTMTFQEEIQLEPVNLARAALRLSQEICYPELDLQRYLTQFEELASAASPILSNEPNPLSQSEQLAHFLFQELGFLGNSAAYDDPRNSYLNEVLDRRLGIPITLSVIYLEIAARLDIPAQGIGLPGHFIVGIQTQAERLFLDPYHGGIHLSVIDCARLVEQSTGYSGPFQPEWLLPTRPAEILTRMLYNLRNVYIQQDNWRLACPVVEHLLALQPQNPDHLRDLGTIHRQNGSLRLAMEYFQRYLALAPQADDARLVRRNLQETASRLNRLN